MDLKERLLSKDELLDSKLCNEIIEQLDLDISKIPDNVNEILNDGKENVELPELGKTYKRKWLIDGKEHTFKCFYYLHIRRFSSYVDEPYSEDYQTFKREYLTGTYQYKRIYSDLEAEYIAQQTSFEFVPIYILADSCEEPYIYEVMCDLKKRGVIE